MIDIPWVAGPSDKLIVEVLETLPGRPISGERLVRPDGKISLGFYGEVHVRGLTLLQVKVAIIRHLRTYLNDEILGLAIMVEDDAQPAPGGFRGPLPVPDIPGDLDPFMDIDPANPAPSSTKPGAGLVPKKLRGTSLTTQPAALAIRTAQFREVSQAPVAKQAPEPNTQPIQVPLSGEGQVKITIEVRGHRSVDVPPPRGGARLPIPETGMGMTWKVVHPETSDRVFVDVTYYNTKNYYVLGDVNTPGRFPCAGSETVLDAIVHAGGLLASANPNDIILVRPGRDGGKPRVYPVDLEDIRDRGDVMTNYQICPGDRLVVGSRRGRRKDVHLDGANGPDRPRVVLSSSRVRTETMRGGDRRARHR
jgi:protein involved in polysaccharide export with SLBB domain